MAECQILDLRSVCFAGSVLDVGGGGEGIISRIAGNSVVAIDIRRDELEETPDIGLKIVMDACCTGFLDNTFDNITGFYTLMYMEHIERFFAEALRILKPGGYLWIWDTVIPELQSGNIFIVPVEVKLTDKTISTAYGVSGSGSRSMAQLVRAAQNAGFSVVENLNQGCRFELRFQKNKRGGDEFGTKFGNQQHE